jgi:hypothetical protein
MRSRPARLTLSALAWIALGAAAFFTFHIQQQVDHRREALSAFESSARDTSDALDDAQVGQQAYLVVGQGPREWSAKVAAYLQTATSGINGLRATALSPAAGPALLDASTAMTQLGNIDSRVRQHLNADEPHAAADTVFAEAADAVSSAVSDIDTAVRAERQAAGDFEARQRRAQVYALGGGAGFAALVLLMLGLASPVARSASPADEAAESADVPDAAVTPAVLPQPAPAVETTASVAADRSIEALKSVAALCTEFGRVRDAAQLKTLLEQSADVMNARGLIVWLGNTAGADLRPVLAHGYSDATLARIPSVARSADNAAAAAYRTGEVQIVRSRPGASQGALVAPLLGADGCIGALTAEIRERGEELESTRALALILAAQLAGVLASAADAASATDADVRTAAG